MKLFKTMNDKVKFDNDPDIARKGIMIVDDSRFSRNVLRDILISEGFNVVGEAVDGLDAIEKAKELRPECIFLDVEMPRMDGLGAIYKLLEQDPGVNVIMCTALGQKKIIVEATKAGAKDYVVKPYRKDNITSIMSSLGLIAYDSDKVIPFQSVSKNSYIQDDFNSKAKNEASETILHKSEAFESVKSEAEKNPAPSPQDNVQNSLSTIANEKESELDKLSDVMVKEENPGAGSTECDLTEAKTDVMDALTGAPQNPEEESQSDVDGNILEQLLTTDGLQQEEELQLTEELQLIEELQMTEQLLLEEELKPIEQLPQEEDLKQEEELVQTEDLKQEEEQVQTEELQPEEELVQTEELQQEEELVQTKDLKQEEELVQTKELQREEELVQIEELQQEEELVKAEVARANLAENIENQQETIDSTEMKDTCFINPMASETLISLEESEIDKDANIDWEALVDRDRKSELIPEVEVNIMEYMQEVPSIEVGDKAATDVSEQEDEKASGSANHDYLWTDRFTFYPEPALNNRNIIVTNRIPFLQERWDKNVAMNFLGQTCTERMIRLGMIKAYMTKSNHKMNNDQPSLSLKRTFHSSKMRSMVTDLLDGLTNQSEMSMSDILSNIDIQTLVQEDKRSYGLYGALEDMVFNKYLRKITDGI